MFGKSLSEYVALYYGWAVGQKGFGSFRQLYGLNLVQGVFSQTLVALAIVLAMVLGQDNIYTTPEFYPPAQGIDVLGLIIGWLLGSLVLVATRKWARPAAA